MIWAGQESMGTIMVLSLNEATGGMSAAGEEERSESKAWGSGASSAPSTIKSHYQVLLPCHHGNSGSNNRERLLPPCGRLPQVNGAACYLGVAKNVREWCSLSSKGEYGYETSSLFR